MKISPIPASGVPTPTLNANGPLEPAKAETIRALKMATNATPLAGSPPELPIPANNETKATVEATQPLSPQLAEIAKRRRALQVKERELLDREKALQSPSSNAVDIARLKSEPLSVLLENGVTYDQLTEAILAGQGNSEINALKMEIESLKKGIDQKFIDKDTAAEQHVLAEMRREAQQLVKDDTFELVRETRSIPDVMRLIERTYRENGEVLDVSEALRLVEAELFKDAQKIARIKKVQGQLSPAPPPQPQQRYQGMRTLTNKDTASVPLSAKARAMAAFYGTLKK